MAEPPNAYQTGAVFWELDKEQWELQREIMSYVFPNVTNTTTFEEIEQRRKELIEQVIQLNMIPMQVAVKPTWVMQEFQDRRLPITRETLTGILQDPLGINHFGFHTPLPRKKKP